LLKEQGSYNLVQNKGPEGLKPKYYSILFWPVLGWSLIKEVKLYMIHMHLYVHQTAYYFASVAPNNQLALSTLYGMKLQ